MKKIYLTAIIYLFFTSCTSSQDERVPVVNNQAGVYTNPVFSHDFPDPNLVKGTDGYFYAYSTEADWTNAGIGGGRRIIPILRSKDLMKWDIVGAALNKKPDWKTDGGIWAPDVTYNNGVYLLYYSFSTWGDPNPGIGVATSTNPQGPFNDLGKLFLSQELGVDNSIDPFLFVEGSKLYLFWGSFHGIYGIELSADGTKITGTKFQVAGNAYEGSYIYKRNNFYYYIGSTGSCCEGVNSTYKVLVGRSANLMGPYVDEQGKSLMDNGGTLLLQRNSANGFVGTGHNGDIITDNAGTTWMLYHAFENKPGANQRVMLLDKISWNNDWPVMQGSQPTTGVQTGPVF